MIKALLLTAALLAPGLAYGDVSAPYPGSRPQPVVPAGSPPAAPPPAQAAGFTTCVVCFDWTASSGGVFVNGSAPDGVNAAQTNTWLDCAGASSPLWYNYLPGYAVAGGCPSIVNDGAGNPRVLQLSMPATTCLSGQTCHFQGMQCCKPTSGSPQFTLPTNFYEEFTVWLPSPLPHNAFTGTFWVTSLGAVSNGNGLEFDSFEIAADASGNTAPGNWISNWINWQSGTACGVPCYLPENWNGGSAPPHAPGYSPTSGYHNIGMRITSDGSSSMYKCMWLDGVFQNCVSQSVGADLLASQLNDTNSRTDGLMTITPYQNTSTNITFVENIKSFNIWSCTNWKTTACSTPGNPDPGGY